MLADLTQLHPHIVLLAGCWWLSPIVALTHTRVLSTLESFA
jgi:hypothetical protein